MGLKQVKYIQIDDQKGVLYSAEKQSLLVPTTFVKVLNDTFIGLVGEDGADILICKIGEAIGKGYAQNLGVILKKEKTELSEETRVKMSCNAIFMEAGWGRVQIINIDLTKQLIKVELAYSPSGEFLEESNYNLERGILVGIYREITQKKVYGELVSRDIEKHSVVLQTIKDVSSKIKEKGKIVLTTRKKLEQMVEQKTEALQKKVNELEKFHMLTVNRELRMIDLKKKIRELEEVKDKMKDNKSAPKEFFDKKLLKHNINCWDFWKCDQKIKEKCPAYKTNSGDECWLVATEYCPYLKKKFKTCDECPWFKNVAKQIKKT